MLVHVIPTKVYFQGRVHQVAKLETTVGINKWKTYLLPLLALLQKQCFIYGTSIEYFTIYMTTLS